MPASAPSTTSLPAPAPDSALPKAWPPSGSLWAWLCTLPARHGRVTGQSRYVPQIDGLRFLAIFPVLVWHSCIRAAHSHPEIPVRAAVAWLPHGHAGVDLFFFVSGYIIAFPFLSGRAPTFGTFVKRRLMRLEPPYMIALALAAFGLLATGYRPSPGEALSFRGDIPVLASLLASLGYVHALVYGAPSIINPPAWSLEVEMQFYLLSPLLIAAYARLPGRARRVAGLMILALLATIGSCLLDARFGRYGLHRWTLAGHAAPFLLGIALSDVALARGLGTSAAQDRKGDWLIVAGIAVWLGSALFWLDEIADPAIGLVRDTARLAAVVAIYWGAMTGQRASGVLSSPWITFVGGMCYSIYLVHIMVMQAGYLVLSHVMPRLPLGLAYPVWFIVLTPLALAVAVGFYLLVERPCMAPDWPRAAWRRLRLAVAA